MPLVVSSLLPTPLQVRRYSSVSAQPSENTELSLHDYQNVLFTINGTRNSDVKKANEAAIQEARYSRH